MVESESYDALWRAASCDAVPYHKDFPEWYTMLVELLNGGKNPTEVSISLEIFPDDNEVKFRYLDNGFGSTFSEVQERFFTWASCGSVNGKSIYGHGTKKFLAKSGPITMPFTIRSRFKGENKINEWVGPYKGSKTKHDIKQIEGFPAHGFEIEFTMEIDRLGSLNTKETAFNAIKEIICSRKKQSTLDSIKFIVEVQDYYVTEDMEEGDDFEEPILEDSITNKWKSLHTTLAEHRDARLLYETTVEIVPGKVRMHYLSYTTGLLAEIPGFPVYGNMGGGKSTRIHCFNEDTMIEAHPWWDMLNVAVHPSQWHRTDFAYFEPIDPTNKDHVDALPQPATTKVAFRYESGVWITACNKIRDIYKVNNKALMLPSKEALKSAAAAAAAASAAAASGGAVAGTSSTAATTATTATGATNTNTGTSATTSSSSTVVNVAPPVYTNTTMNDLFKKFQVQGKTPLKYILPKWYSCEDPIAYKQGDKHVLTFYRERQKGDISNDLEKAYIALSRYANENNVTLQNIEMVFCLHLKTGGSAKIKEFETLQAKMSPTVYPFARAIKFKLMKDIEKI
jgi:hypothetical protein